MIEFLVWLLICLLIFAVLFYVVDMIPLDERLKQIAKVVIGLILLLVVISALLGAPVLRLPGWR